LYSYIYFLFPVLTIKEIFFFFWGGGPHIIEVSVPRKEKVKYVCVKGIHFLLILLFFYWMLNLFWQYAIYFVCQLNTYTAIHIHIHIHILPYIYIYIYINIYIYIYCHTYTYTYTYTYTAIPIYTRLGYIICFYGLCSSSKCTTKNCNYKLKI
jgi:hypothetical protein